MKDPSRTHSELIEENSSLKEKIRELETDRNQLEMLLKKTEQDLRLILDSTPTLIWQKDRNGIYLQVNKAYCDTVGLSKEAVLGKTDYDLFPKEIADKYIDHDHQVLKSGCSESGIEEHHVKPSGEYGWSSTDKFIYCDANGSPSGTIGFATDITNRKLAQEALSDNERRYRALFEGALNPIMIANEDGRYIDANEAALKFLETGRDELLKRNVWDYAPPRLLDKQLHEHSPFLEPRTLETVYLVNGNYKTLILNIVPIKSGEITFLMGIGHDITESRHVQELLAESERKYRLMADNIEDAFWMATPEIGEMIYISPAYEKIWGRSRKSLYEFPRSFIDAVHQEDREPTENILSEARTNKSSWTSTYRIVRPDGSIRWIEDRGFPVFDDQKKHYLNTGIAKDITERKRLECTLREREERLRILFEYSPTSIWEEDFSAVKKRLDDLRMEGVSDWKDYFDEHPEVVEELVRLAKVIDVNQTSVDFFHAENKENLKLTLADYFTEESLIVFKQELITLAEGGISFESEIQIRNLRGDIQILWLTLKVDPSKAETMERVLVSFYDITDSKRARLALQESEERFRTIYENAPILIDGFDANGRCVLWNKECEKVFGWAMNEINTYDEPLALFYPDSEIRKQVIDTVSLKPENIFREWHPLTRDGKELTVLWANFQLPDGMIINIGLDITENKEAKEALRNSERQRDDIIDFFPDAILAIDNEKRIIIWNRAIEELTGIPAQEMLGKGDYAYTVPFYGDARPQLMDLVLSDNEELKAKYPQIQREGDTLVAEAFCKALYDNKGAWVYAKASPLRDQEGNVKGVIEIIRDISEQKRYENALKDYQRNLTDIINFLPDATFVIDKEGIVTAWNNAMVSMTGIKAEEMIGKGNYEYAIPFYGERRPIIIDLILSANEDFLRKSYDAIQYQEAVLSGEVYVPETFGGRGAYLWGNASRLCNANGEVIGAIQSIRDITDRKRAEVERKELEERLQRSEKMEALGTLAGGVAHDLNNVLGIVVGYSELLMDEIDESSPLRDDVTKIMEGGQRSAAIVQDLLTLARRGVQTRNVFNLNTVITDCQKTPEFEKVSSFNPKVRIDNNLETDLLNMMGSPIHLGKTIINLVANAVEAMPGGGVLSMITSNQSLDKPVHGYDTVNEGDYVVLSITDTGEGISDHDIKHIFEPFYTKKAMGRSGTGLGLAVVWGTVKDHNGYIDVQSEVGKGTTFTLYFPVTREEIDKAETTIPLSEYIGNDESILVIDDIKEQRELAAKMLGKLNYMVKTVSSGEEAVEYLRTGRADLLVLDMIMDPGMDGLDTYIAILKLHPEQKAIIVSGFSETERVKEARALGAGEYIRKPYVQERLGIAVRKELDRQ